MVYQICRTTLPVCSKQPVFQRSQDPISNKASALQTVMDKLGNGLVRLGEDVISAGGQLGGMFVGLGNNLRGTM